MIPRIHNRGTSFHGVSQYVLHDPKSQTSERVMWTHTEGLGDVEAADAWRVMRDTWRDRTRLKREAGVDLRGRDNTTPVMHYTLSWSPDEQPTQEHMIEAAKATLKAMGLDQHQVLMAAHNDTEHPHVHIVVNTVHPETGRTAPLKYSQRELQAWAAEYEREHGIHCDQRIKNQEDRDRYNAAQKASENIPPPPTPALQPEPTKQPVKSSYVPSYKRADYIAKADIINRMKRLRAEVEHHHLVLRDVTASQHRQERQEMYRDAESAVGVAMDHVRDRFKSRWRDLYEAQRVEFAQVIRIQGNPIERAAFVIANSERLGNGSPLSTKAKAALIQSPTKLFETVETMHTRERRALSNVQKVEVKTRLDRVWQVHEQRMGGLIARQTAERVENRAIQKNVADHSADFMLARNQLKRERSYGEPVRMATNAPPLENDVQYVARIKADTTAHYQRNASPEALERMNWFRNWKPDPPASEPASEKVAAPLPAVEFNQAVKPPSPLSRAEQIKQDMAAWRAKNEGKDFGNER